MNNYLKWKVEKLSIKIFISILLMSSLIFSFSINKILTAQEKDKIKYYNSVDKTYYYTRFVNEIPYFLINRYDFYYQVVYEKNEDNIKEVSVFNREKEIEKWLYEYPQPGIVVINYNKVELLKSQETKSSKEENNNNNYSGVLEEEIKTILTPIGKDIFYYKMGKLIKCENYTAKNELNFYFNINYKENKINTQYYYNSNDSFIYKYYNYDKENNLSYILRRGIIKNNKTNKSRDSKENNENLLTITEKWLYDNNRLNSIEKYEGSSLKEKFYFNEYGIITKKEIFNNILRITHFYMYEYNKDLKLINIKKYKALDPFRSISKESILLEEYSITENNILTTKIYNNNIVIEEQFLNYPEKTITQINYTENGNITNIEYMDVIDEISYKVYSEDNNKLIQEIKIDIYNRVRKDIEYNNDGNISNMETKKIEKKDRYILDKDHNAMENEDKKPYAIINFEDKTITEISYNEEGNINKRLKSKVINNFDNYLSILKLQPKEEIILVAPDNYSTFTREN